MCLLMRLQTVRKAGFYIEADCTDRKMQKKVREAQLDQYNYILVVGADEAAAGTVNIRTRDNMVCPRAKKHVCRSAAA